MTARPTLSNPMGSARLGGCRRLAVVFAVTAVAFSSAAAACSSSDSTSSRAQDFAKRVDIGGGRKMYIECHGTGSPTVLLLSGTDAASDLWHSAEHKGLYVYDEIGKLTRVCA
jgi:hypothetical protein